jgi:photosystem II stability/assembly factor-like uncharacterized protein
MFRINKILQLVIAACLLITSTTVFAQTWVPLNGPQVATNVKDISLSGNFVYIAEQDYLLKSTNGGTAWKGTTSNFTTPSVVLCKPDNSNIVIASRQNFFKYSIDGGVTWGNVTPSIIIDYLTPLRLSASPVNTSNMFLGRKYDASTTSVWRSIDGGGVWNYCQNFTWATDVNDIAAYPVGGVGRDYELWVCGSDPNAIPKYPRSTTALASIRGIWYSNNAGLNWQAKTMGDYDLKTMAVVHKASPTDPLLFAATGDGEIYKSSNYGIDWSLNYTSGVTVRLLRVNNVNNYIFLATNNGVYRSTNEGTNWATANNGLGTDLDVLSISLQPNSNNIVVGTANSLYKSINNGATWQEVGKMNVSSLTITGSSMWTVTKDNAYTGNTTNGGSTWFSKYIGSAGMNFSSENIYRKSDNDLYVAGSLNNSARLYRSTDLGNNFSSLVISDPLPSNGKTNGTVVHPITSTQLWCYGGCLVNSEWKSIFSSADGGQTWNALATAWVPNAVYVNDLKALNIGTGRLFAALSNGKIYRSDDNGGSWTEKKNIGLNQSANSIVINPVTSDIIYVGGSNGLWKTTDAGNTWSLQSMNAIRKINLNPGYPSSVNHLVAITSDGIRVLSSTNGGSNWSEMQAGLPTPINDIYGVPGTPAVLYTATAKGIYKTSGLLPTDKPTLSSPADGATVGIIPTLTWSSVTGATAYHIQIATDVNFTNLVVNNNNVASTSFAPTTLNEGTYYWRVAANNFIGESDFTISRSYTSGIQGTITLSVITFLGVDGLSHPRLSWTGTGQGPTYYLYRYECTYGVPDCGVWPYPLLLATTSTSYDDYDVAVVRKGETPATTYWYQVRSAAVSNKVTRNSAVGQDSKIGIAEGLFTDLLPKETKLYENYPNPFNPATTLKYSLAEDLFVSIKVYDVLGREVKSLVDEFQEAGYKSVTFDAGNLPSGVYYYRMTAGKYTDIKKMLLLR